MCFVGDSFVAGVGDPEHLGWAGRLAARSHRAGEPLTAYVLGVRRQTSRDIAVRWRGECTARLPAGCDGRVVISLGVNDTSAENGATRVLAADSARNLEGTLSGVHAAGWSAFVVGPLPVADREHNERTAGLDARLAAVCESSGVGCVRVFDQLVDDPVWMAEVAAGDGAHPGADGYRRLADLVWPHWQGWTTATTT